MILLSAQESERRTDENLLQAVRQPAGFGISLFRSHGHSGIFAAAHASGTHRPFLPRRPRRLSHHQRGPAQADRRVQPLGGSLRPQPPHSAPMARPKHEEEKPEEGGLRPALLPQYETP